MVRQAPVICVMVPPIHLGAWSMALMLWLPFELLLYAYAHHYHHCSFEHFKIMSHVQDHVAVGTRSHLHGVSFPIDQDALQALKQLGKEISYVRLVS